MSDILVSIVCIAYNHEKYIAEAIDSFLMQKTNFKYEILINDDASTDRTAQIIREYEKKYPDIIKPVYQTENQYSKGIKIGYITSLRAEGKYIAFCEGDDYWTNPYKLQKQVDYMESNPDCSMCVHASYVVNTGGKIIRKHRPYSKSRIISTEEIIEGGGGLFMTNSMMYLNVYNKERPDFYYIVSVGDYPTAIHMSLKGNVYYIDEFLSAYRRGVINSWTNNISKNIDMQKKLYNDLNIMLDEINIYTNNRYKDTISRTKEQNELYIHLLNNDYKKIDLKLHKKFIGEMPLLERLKIRFKVRFPKLSKKIVALKRKYCARRNK